MTLPRTGMGTHYICTFIDVQVAAAAKAHCNMPLAAHYFLYDCEKTWEKTARNRSRSLIGLVSSWHSCHAYGVVERVSMTTSGSIAVLHRMYKLLGCTVRSTSCYGSWWKLAAMVVLTWLWSCRSTEAVCANNASSQSP